jgi:hypothetical protein
MPEVHEACGLDVDAMYSVIEVLREAGLIKLEGEYPYEEIRLTGAALVMESVLKQCEAGGIALEDLLK